MDIFKAEKLCQEAVALWGHEEQIKMWHEEVGELMQAINKHHRKPTPENLDHLCEETVDVKILTMQLEIMAPEDRIKYWFDFKMNRLELRINAEKQRRQEFEENLSQVNPEYYAIFQMINEIGPNPLGGQIDDLVNLVIKQHEIKKEREFKELF
ncbi:hypothetical protein [Flavobacterium sp. FlaQc-50]|uniref:hypothetical protein n=1 Tax=unclassified Flavobacterium TaxID=196869 RepID=UPI0037564846